MKRFWFLMLCSLSAMVSTLHAQDATPLQPAQFQSVQGVPEAPTPVLRTVAALPVLHDGRVMPLDSFARIHLIAFSGRKTFEGKDAMTWMMEILMAPESTRDAPMFLVNHHAVLEAMEVEIFEETRDSNRVSTRRFSYNHLEPGLPKLGRLAMEAQQKLDRQEELDPVEKEIMRLYGNLYTYRSLGMVFEYLRPSPQLSFPNPELRQLLRLDPNREQFSYMELRPRVEAIGNRLQASSLGASPSQADLAAAMPDDGGASMFLFQAMLRFSTLSKDTPFTVLPAAPHGEPIWMAPFDARYDRHQDKELENAARRMGEFAQAWMSEDWDEVLAAYEDVTAFTTQRMSHMRDVGLTVSEVRYNRANFFVKAKWLYLLGFLIAFAHMITGKALFRKVSMAPIGLAALWHLIGMIWRVYLTARPPVTNLYSTFLFVGLVVLILGFCVELSRKNGLGLFAGSFIAATFLMLAERFGMEGDTLHKMQAVLASNFWLSTHVQAVTVGYAGVWIAGFFGHIWLILKMLNRPEKQLRGVMEPMMGLLGFGLTFAFLGTMLGGVWADQSWGRFWGWDPKENGAILIVLWVAVVYHARIAGMIRDVGTAAGSAIGCIMVMLAWLGVNLLGAGLHSYGFTDAMAYTFFTYIAGELIFISVVVGVIKIREGAAEVAANEAVPKEKAKLLDAPVGLELLAGVQVLWGVLGICIFAILAMGFHRPDITDSMRELGMSPFFIETTALVLFSMALAGGIGLNKRATWGWVSSVNLMLLIIGLKICALIKLELRILRDGRELFEAQLGSPKTLALQHVLPMALAILLLVYLLRPMVRDWCGVDKSKFGKIMILSSGAAACLAVLFTYAAMMLS